MGRFWGGIAAGLATLLLVALPAWASEDKLEDYGGVAPAIPCPRVTSPPDLNAATLLITCAQSYDNFAHAKVERTFNVQLRMHPPRAYALGDPGGNEIVASAPVYPITGSWSTVTCSPVSDYMKNAGKNCLRVDFQGDGMCYLNPTTAWKCVIGGTKTDSFFNVPPPPS